MPGFYFANEKKPSVARKQPPPARSADDRPRGRPTTARPARTHESPEGRRGAVSPTSSRGRQPAPPLLAKGAGVAGHVAACPTPSRPASARFVRATSGATRSGHTPSTDNVSPEPRRRPHPPGKAPVSPVSPASDAVRTASRAMSADDEAELARILRSVPGVRSPYLFSRSPSRTVSPFSRTGSDAVYRSPSRTISPSSSTGSVGKSPVASPGTGSPVSNSRSGEASRSPRSGVSRSPSRTISPFSRTGSVEVSRSPSRTTSACSRTGSVGTSPLALSRTSSLVLYTGSGEVSCSPRSGVCRPPSRTVSPFSCTGMSELSHSPSRTSSPISRVQSAPLNTLLSSTRGQSFRQNNYRKDQPPRPTATGYEDIDVDGIDVICSLPAGDEHVSELSDDDSEIPVPNRRMCLGTRIEAASNHKVNIGEEDVHRPGSKDSQGERGVEAGQESKHEEEEKDNTDH